MKLIIKGLKLIGLGIMSMICFVLKAVWGVITGIKKKIRAWRLKRATAYVSKYGYELDIQSRVRLGGKAYYVFSINTCEDIEHRREVSLNLIGVPQYREIVRRTR